MSQQSNAPALGRNAIGAVVASAIMECARKHLLATWSPKTHQGITREQALEAARQVFGYVSPNAWSYTDPHPFYGVRNVGRPAPKQVAPASKSTARPGGSTARKSTASKSTAPASKSTARKGAPARSTATPASVARVASKSTAGRKGAPASK